MFQVSRRFSLLLLLPTVLLLGHSQIRAQDRSQLSRVTPESVLSGGSPAAANVPDKPLELQGDMFLARGDYAAALEAYKHAEPRSAVTWNKEGIAYHHLFALDEALKNYKMALALNPHYAEAYNNLGAVYHGKREFGQAEKSYKRALKYNPRAAIIYRNLGTSYFAELKFKQGVKAYEKALELDPDIFSHGHQNAVEETGSRTQRREEAFYLAEVYARAGRLDAALDSLRRAFMEGFDDRKRVMEDKNLLALRGTPGFQKLMVDEHLE
jgi:tetratricopeptide (TPR) repeat protein